MTRYLSGLCVAGLGLCGGGWLVVAAVAFGGMDGGDAGKVNLATGAGLMVIAGFTAAAWAVAWRRRMRADGVLGMRFGPVSRRQARRNRRELTRDVRRAARSAKRSAREARRRARRFPRLADGELDGLDGLGGLGGGLTGTGSLGSGLSGGGLGEPRGWIGGWTGHAPHGTGRGGPRLTGTVPPGPEPAGPEPAETGLLPDAGQGGRSALPVPGQAGPSAAEVLGQLRVLLAPLLTAAEPEAASPPLPQRQPGQERPAIPRRPAGQAPRPAVGDSGGDAGERAAADSGGDSAGPAGGLLAGDQELLDLADREETWW